jgi:elongator complex protein 3
MPEAKRSVRPVFDPADHRRELHAILDEVVARPDFDARELDQILRRHPKDGRGFFSRSDLIAAVRAFEGERPDVDTAGVLERLRLRPVRTLSGVTPLTVLTRPFPCPGRCIFCPNDVRMPKSYLSAEPGAQRAENNRFDPYLQTWNRLAAFHQTGHPVDKVELIVLGGTWSFYPEPYQVWFVTRCLEALVDFGCGRDRREGAGIVDPGVAGLPHTPADGSRDGIYNRTVGPALTAAHGPEWLHHVEAGVWADLERAQRENESAGSRCVGLVVETRPDHVDPAEILRLRRLGVTKVQIGVQSLSDDVLALNRRGHDVAATRRALTLLRAAGFKLHAHWMPNLHGATVAGDIRDFARLFDDPAIRPDELKIYPCSLVESAELMEPYRRGEWRPYDGDELLAVLEACLAGTPRWCRITRVIRDFSSDDIVDGNRVANLREVAERRVVCRDIRAREIRGARFDAEALRLRETAYPAGSGEERFLEYVTPDDRLVGFLRLHLPAAAPGIDELRESALIREVHVYGASLPLGERGTRRAQHRGLGGALVERADEIARQAGYCDLAVISAIGTRNWYRELGFRDGPLYQHRSLDRTGRMLA